MSDELHHECGIAGLYWLNKSKGKSGQASRALNSGNVTALMPAMLLDLQNRGQLAAGLSSYNPNRVQFLDTYKDIGTVGDINILGDANLDGVVSAGDYTSVQNNFGNTGEPGIPGDANYDGVVSAGDYTSVQNNFGNNGAADGTLDGDANADGVVSAGDYTSVQNNFGNHLPEPTTICMMGIALVALIRRRRRCRRGPARYGSSGGQGRRRCRGW
ncbi:hypothetical protein LCGC14_1823960 [marine sediment metagenome]|uniref:Ice-binding protein C-terminal domain-containing protein n=1 Tax=marine sediment metagenome TaxID=412755 RepID=A0A0F9JHK2_9ZZZZ